MSENPGIHPLIEIDETDELADTLHSHRLLPLYDVHNLLIIHFKTFPTDIDAKELYLFLMEFTLFCITEELHILQTLKGIANMFGLGLMMIEHIVQVILQVLIEQRCKHLIHVSLEAGRHVCETEGHDSHLVQPERSHECCFPFISRADLNLVVPGFQIELHEDFRATDMVHHFVDPR
jgi:hypothetical protein